MINLKILIVDDDQDYLKSLSLVLENEGYSVHSAMSVDEAFTKLRGYVFDLVLVDLRLTDNENELDVSGFNVTKYAEEKQIPCIVITGFSSIETMRKSLIAQGKDAIAVDYIAKQDGPQKLLDAIQGIFGVTLLHISDLHPQILNPDGISFDQETAFAQFVSDVKKQTRIGLYPIKAALISGDISFQCQQASFDWAKRYLKYLASEIDIPIDKIILAPGNHDVCIKRTMSHTLNGSSRTA
jgi:CheY-like chemotaxis protein